MGDLDRISLAEKRAREPYMRNIKFLIYSTIYMLVNYYRVGVVRY